MYRLLILIALFWLQPAFAIDPDELLPPEQAFQFTAQVISTDKVKLNWEIAEGYYLYRQKFQFSSSTSGITLTDAKLPTGETKQDQFFGNVEIYRHHLDIELPITRQNPDIDEINLEVSYQGCAELGVCYLPIRKQLTLNLNNKRKSWFDF